MGGSQGSRANYVCHNTVLPCTGYSCVQRHATPELLMRLLQSPWLPMSSFIYHIKGYGGWEVFLWFLHYYLSLLSNFQEVRPSDFDIRWWIRYLHEYQEDGCEDFTLAVDAMRASPGICFVFLCLYLACIIAIFFFFFN
jgi:hypothetical protein